MCNKQLLDWNCGAEMLKMVVKLIFSTIFFAVPLFLPIFAIAKRTMVVHPGEQRLLLGHQKSGFFYARQKREEVLAKRDIGGCHSVEFDQPIG